MEEMKTIDLHIGGMSCVMCSRTVENALSGLEGVAGVSVNHATGIARVNAKEGARVDLMEKAIRGRGTNSWARTRMKTGGARRNGASAISPQSGSGSCSVSQRASF